MGMVGCFRTASDDTIQALIANPKLIYGILHDDWSAAKPRKRGIFPRLVGTGPPDDDPVEPLTESEDDKREIDVDKSWHGLHYLLTGSAEGGEPPLHFIVMGGRDIGNEDVGYGPARAFTSDHVQLIQQALTPFNEQTLRNRFDPAAMTSANIYPQIWDEGEDAFEYLMYGFNRMKEFIDHAASRNLGMIVWLS